MGTHCFRKQKKHGHAWMPAVGLLAILLLSASACANYGRLRPVADMRKNLDNPMQVTGYKYYYDGTEGYPYHVIGLQRGYVFSSRFWTPIAPAAVELKKRVAGIRPYSATSPYVFDILDPRGSVVGVLYSAEPGATVRFGPGRSVRLDNAFSHGRHPSSIGGGK